MPFLMLWLRREARLRWRALLALGLLLALVSATVLMGLAGARRGASAVDRLLAVTRPATAEVVPNQPGFDWDRVRALPGVEALTTFPGYTGLIIDGVPGDTPTPFVPADQGGMHTIEAPIVLDGRLANPARFDEAVVTPEFARSTGYGVGDTVTAQLLTPAQADASISTNSVGRPAGPAVRLRIVGVVRSLWYGDDVGGSGSLIPSPGLLARYRANFLGASGTVPLNAIVRLRGGDTDLPAFRAELARVTHVSTVDVLSRADVVRHDRSVTTFESSCLLAFALAASIAGLVLVGQAIVRHVTASGSALRALGAVGLTRVQAATAAAVGPLLTAIAGTGVGVGLAIGASRWMPFGVAATKEPHPGLSSDWLVLGAGWALIPLLVAGAAAATASRAMARYGNAPALRQSIVAQAIAMADLPVPAVIGARFALEPGRGRNAVPARPALLGSIIGVLGVTAAFTFAAGVSDAAAHPERFGQTYQLLAIFGFDGQDFRPVQPALRTLAADPAVDGITNMRVAAANSGATSVLTHTYDAVGAPAALVLTAGVPPGGPQRPSASSRNRPPARRAGRISRAIDR